MLYAIAPTQFTPDGRSVDAAAMAANVERLAESGIRTRAAHRRLWRVPLAELIAERIAILRQVKATGACESIMACAASLSAEATARLALNMLDEGADSAMVAAPLACETTESDVLRHFEYLAKTVGRQLVVYNNPVFGHDLEPRVMAEVMAMEAYVGVKQGTRDTVRLLGSVEAIRSTARPVQIFIASDLSAALTLACARRWPDLHQCVGVPGGDAGPGCCRRPQRPGRHAAHPQRPGAISTGAGASGPTRRGQGGDADSRIRRIARRPRSVCGVLRRDHQRSARRIGRMRRSHRRVHIPYGGLFMRHYRVAVLGGDGREVHVAQRLARDGHDAVCYGQAAGASNGVRVAASLGRCRPRHRMARPPFARAQR